MNDTARRLHAQKAYSTDPAYLERMTREEVARDADPTNDRAAEGGEREHKHEAADLIKREASTIGRQIEEVCLEFDRASLRSASC
jgi:hypothetical protein